MRNSPVLGLACRMAVMVLLLPAVAISAPQPPAPTTSPAPTPPTAARDLKAELEQIQAQVSRLDPKSSDYAVVLKSILSKLVSTSHALVEENAALRRQLVGTPPAERRSSGTGSARVKAATTLDGPVVLFGKRGLKKYHRTGCQFGDRVKEEDRQVFATPAAAAAAGYEPCKVCRPDAAGEKPRP